MRDIFDLEKCVKYNRVFPNKDPKKQKLYTFLIEQVKFQF